VPEFENIKSNYLMEQKRDIQLNGSTSAGILPMQCYRQATGSFSSEAYNMCCIEGMKHYPDKYFDLAVVDPPYGIDDKLQFHDTGTAKNRMYGKKRWDLFKVDERYLTELFRVSKNIIFWGGNYYANLLPASRGWIFWQKFSHNNLKYSHGELAWTSFDRKLEMTKIFVDGISGKSQVIHPTQKPIQLYDFCFQFAKVEPGMKVLDTHLGSGSSRIAAYKNKLHFVGFEIDRDYYEKQGKRFTDFAAQLVLF
jgi:site-specific DNA-methyltransferase (adenine-specific)